MKNCNGIMDFHMLDNKQIGIIWLANSPF